MIKPLEELKQMELADFAELPDSYIQLQGMVETQYGAVKVVSNTWSAILDTRTCELCRSLDGKTLPEGHPDFEAYQPPLHSSCRCLFLGHTTESKYKPPIDWEPPDKGLLEKFGNFIKALPEKELPEIIGVWEPTQTIETSGWAEDIQITKLKNEVMKEAKDGEAFILIDGRTGSRILRRAGGKDYVDLKDIDDILAKAKADRFVTFHNHPKSASFGPEDLKFFVKMHSKGVRHHIIFGNDGTEYRLIFPKTLKHIGQWQNIDYAWKLQIDKSMDYYRERVLSGILDENFAWKEHSHEALKKLSEKYGFIYERVLP